MGTGYESEGLYAGGIFLVPSALTHKQVCRLRRTCFECDQFVSDTPCLINT